MMRGLSEIGKDLVAKTPRIYRALQNAEMATRHVTRSLHDSDYRVFSDLPDGLVLDIGANVGQSAVSIAVVNRRVEILSIEANPDCANHLRFAQRLIGKAHHYRIVGIGEKTEILPFFVPVTKGLSCWQEGTFDRSILDHEYTRSRLGSIERIEERNLYIVTIDSLNLSPIGIKLDIQGHEKAALLGAVQTLRRCEPLLLIEKGPYDDGIGEFLRYLGYMPKSFDGASGLNAIWECR